RTRLPFPVHVVSRVQTYDAVGRNRFVSRYDYHHGYFDPVEREFHGFARVEQHDTDFAAALTADGELPPSQNLDPATARPAAVTTTWFHTGAYTEALLSSRVFAD